MSFPPGRITIALLFLALAVSACASAGNRPFICHTHQVSDGELTECD